MNYMTDTPRFAMVAIGRIILSLVLLSLCCHAPAAPRSPKYSTAGFYELDGSGRKVYSMNPGWRFCKGSAPGAEAVGYDDSGWAAVSLPDGIELLPTEASGCVNYQGDVWYRKHFTPADSLAGKRLFLHFEAIMGKSKVWVNGELVAEHYGGFLPVIADITDNLRLGQPNVIAVWADNSDDPSYPPGKAQDQLDFTYAGGIYRDCWLISHDAVYITDPNYENIPAGGGLFVSYGKVSDAEADVNLGLHVRNSSAKPFSGKAEWTLRDGSGAVAARADAPLSIGKGGAKSVKRGIKLRRPHLWSPDTPYLYSLDVRVLDSKGRVVDGYTRRIGVRSIEFKGKDGFWLNGKPYPSPLIGANRHQDFAVIGNALPNSLHWRDAKKLRDAGLRVIRNAHYPQDPAFMDACDELGLFVIVNTPGWQFWNDDPAFGERVYSDIRNMVRRDRNHPSVWLWEPILNETNYPADFAKNVVGIVAEEYPYAYSNCACDAGAKGYEYFKIRFAHPAAADTSDPEITYFTREWGDNVDDWNSHNSPSRVGRGWGEFPMLRQARDYAYGYENHTSYNMLCSQPRQHVGGCLWHSFDHQRGYHPLPFYGGIMDNFRQPKLSWHMFAAQRPARPNPGLIADSGPYVYIANAMTPVSPVDVTVYSNCDEVRLLCCAGGDTLVYHNPHAQGMPSPVITFPGAWDVMRDKKLSRSRARDDSYLIAQGVVGGEVVAEHKVVPARRPSKVILWADNEGMPLVADGSDMVAVVAAVADKDGNIRRLESYEIVFEIEGPGTLVADEATFTNPRRTEWGTAPVLVRATATPGEIKVKASVAAQGEFVPLPATLVLSSVPAAHPIVADMADVARSGQRREAAARFKNAAAGSLPSADREEKLKVVEQQQSDFE